MSNLHDSGVLKIAVASDLHAYQSISGGSVTPPSHLKVLGSDDSVNQDPLRHLSELIESSQLKADLLLSPGDLGDKASVEGVKYAWKSLHEIGKKLKVHLVTASSGNHDLDSRYQDYTVDPAETLQRLNPPYPLPYETDNDKYWARKYALIQSENYRLVVLNSAAYHGGKPEEIKHGRISSFTISRLEKELSESLFVPKVNILLCHHHPHQFPEISEEDETYDIMKNGQNLLSMLGNGRNGNWIVIHGHKHHARATYSQGGNSSPFVMAAGSFSAVLYHKLQSYARNQFYLLELPLNDPSGFVGTIRAWDWTPRGWIPAMTNGSGFPAISKFGCRSATQNLASRINQLLIASPVENWSTILLSVPEVEFLLPDDLSSLIHVLKTQFSINVELESGTPRELGRVKSK
jgi:3',5'-cyclic AMP phosphodiesterase CpdA